MAEKVEEVVKTIADEVSSIFINNEGGQPLVKISDEGIPPMDDKKPEEGEAEGVGGDDLVEQDKPLVVPPPELPEQQTDPAPGPELEEIEAQQLVENPEIRKEDFNVIGAGTYGCVMEGKVCNVFGTETGEYSGIRERKNDFVTKLQVQSHASTKEKHISTIIQERIPHYSKYFSTILNVCEVTTSILDSKTGVMKSCESMASKDLDDEDIIEMYTMKNEKGLTYDKHMYQIVSVKDVVDAGLSYVYNHEVEAASGAGQVTNTKKSKARSYRESPYCITDTTNWAHELHHIVAMMMRGLQLLRSAGVCHYDLKRDNIIVNSKSMYPVVIDFGVSFSFEELVSTLKSHAIDDNKEMYLAVLRDALVAYAPQLHHICPEVSLFSYFCHKTAGSMITSSDIDKIVSERLDDKYFKSICIFDEKAKEYYRSQSRDTMTSIMKKYGSDGLIGLTEEFDRCVSTWDAYSFGYTTVGIIRKLCLHNKVGDISQDDALTQEDVNECMKNLLSRRVFDVCISFMNPDVGSRVSIEDAGKMLMGIF